MAYRRKHAPQRSLTFIEDCRSSSRGFNGDDVTSPCLASPRLARAAAALASPSSAPSEARNPLADGGLVATSPRNTKVKHLTRSAYSTPQMSPSQSHEGYQKSENLSFNGRSEFSSTLHQIGGTIKDALEEGLTVTEHKTADISQETRKLQIWKRSGSFTARNRATDLSTPTHLYPILNDYETQLKASRDVANAMAAKAKLLLRELKTVKADLAFAKERCSQLEEENKLMRENRDKGDGLDNEDLIRLQLETLLEEKRRLAHDNSLYARENLFLREIVEYHQLTMQDVMYVDEGIEEDEEVCPDELPPHLSHSTPRHLSPIMSRPESSNDSSNPSPQSFNLDDPTELYLTAGSPSPASPSSPRDGQFKKQEEKPASSPKTRGLSPRGSMQSKIQGNNPASSKQGKPASSPKVGDLSSFTPGDMQSQRDEDKPPSPNAKQERRTVSSPELAGLLLSSPRDASPRDMQSKRKEDNSPSPESKREEKTSLKSAASLPSTLRDMKSEKQEDSPPSPESKREEKTSSLKSAASLPSTLRNMKSEKQENSLPSPESKQEPLPSTPQNLQSKTREDSPPSTELYQGEKTSLPKSATSLPSTPQAMQSEKQEVNPPSLESTQEEKIYSAKSAPSLLSHPKDMQFDKHNEIEIQSEKQVKSPLPSPKAKLEKSPQSPESKKGESSQISSSVEGLTEEESPPPATA